ncbi:MAG: Maf family protein, partial [Myxococcales bacterium]|nr:Maf family protein [Myxococcales bacterium]
MPPLVLASTSRWRAELLARLELPFETRAPDYDERLHDHRFAALGPHDFALHLARGKAESLVSAYPAGAWILAADQIAVIGSDEAPELLHKPGSEANAVAQLLRLRGRSHRLITAVVLLRAGPEDGEQGGWSHAIDEQRLTMRD